MQPVFYDRTAAQALSDMDSDRAGLSPAEAAARLARYGLSLIHISVLFADPLAPVKALQELEAWMDAHGVKSVRELSGAVEA